MNIINIWILLEPLTYVSCYLHFNMILTSYYNSLVSINSVYKSCV